MQLAQDGVQFRDVNYKASRNESLLMMSGNRADMLVRAPSTPCDIAGGCSYPVRVQNEVDPSDRATAAQLTLFTVNVSGTPVDPGAHGGEFIPQAPKFPPFLADVTRAEIKARRTLTFSSSGGPPFTQHMIDGKKFDGSVGAKVRLNRAEEWKIVNATYAPLISHPFHIHLNPFQVVEVFAPNEPLIDPKTGKAPVDPATGKPYVDPQTGKPAVKYAFHKDGLAPGQCYLDPDKPASWKPCDTPPATSHPIWWDVFPIPSGYAPRDKAGNRLLDSHNNPIQVPGYFKMRSRFVDYPGFYVLHCHILAHEDRGMMTVVEVEPAGKAFAKMSPFMHS
jgi:FtsP/CotA-like multicopper oxidase with cupredoxin domain